MASKENNNPLSPLSDDGLSRAEKDRIWDSIMDIVQQESLENTSSQRTRKSRFQALKSIMAGVAAIALVCGAWTLITYHHWAKGYNEASKDKKNHPTQQKTQPISHITDIHMATQTDGWAEKLWGNKFTLLHTTDGGHTWQIVTPKIQEVGNVNISNINPIEQNEFTAAFPGPNQAILAWAILRGNSGQQIVSDNILIESTNDGGKHWNVSTIKDNVLNQYGQKPVGFDFINSKVGWLTTMPKDPGGVMFLRNGLYKTTDGGTHWTKVSVTNLSNPNSLPATNSNPDEGWVSFINQSIGFTLGEPPTQSDVLDATKPSLYRTSNGGATWTKVTIPPLPHPYHIVFVRVLPPQAIGNTIILPVVTETANPSSYTFDVYVSHDGGQRFSEQNGKTSVSYNGNGSIQYGFWNTMNGWFWFGGTLYQTANGGQSIMRVKMDHSFTSPMDNSVISWLDQTTGLVNTQSGLWKTIDGGQHWVKLQ